MADGLGGATRERKLEIMRDSRTGSYGVIALLLSLGARGAAIALLAGGTRKAAAHSYNRNRLRFALFHSIQPGLHFVYRHQRIF